MKTSATERNRRIIGRYGDQPEAMPAAARERFEAAWQGRPVQLYALADLDDSMRLARVWLALGPEQVGLLEENADGRFGEVQTIARTKIKHVREIPSISCATVLLMGQPDQPALAVLRYSFRQQAAMGPILFILRQQTEGNALRVPEDQADAIYAENMASSIRKAQSSVTKDKMAIVWRLLSYLKPYRKQFTFGILAAALLTAVSLAPPYLTGLLIDEVVMPLKKGAVEPQTAYRTALGILAVIVAAFLAQTFFLWVRLRTTTTVGEYVARDLRRNIYEHLQKLSVNYFSNHQTGGLITRVSSDTDRIWDFIAFGVTELTLSLLMVIGLSAVLIALDWRLGLILVLPMPLVFFFIYVMGRRLHAIFMRVWQKWSNMTAVLSDTIPGIRVVKAFNQENYECRRFDERNVSVTDEAVHINKVWSTRWPFITLTLGIMTILVWLFGLPRMLGAGPDGQVTLAPGVFVSFLLYMGRFIGPIEAFGFLTRMINRSLSSAHRVFEVLDTEPEITTPRAAKKLEPLRGRITFEEVTFGYDPVRQILKGISFDVEPGEMIGLVGPSGAGKTTVINLIARFFDVSTGAIRIDGVNIQDLDLGHYRRQIGIVMQEPYLFHGSILENICYACRETDAGEVIAAAKAANAHDFICKLPNGYDTIVGERGHTLSGGERQRVSIARAILHNPRILVLDEATSSVDTETERKIQEAIERLISGRTVIAIAHRLSTLRRAHRLFVLKEGKMAESGSHEELLKKPSGLYEKLYRMQRELHEMRAI